MKKGFWDQKNVCKQFLEHLEHLENPDNFEIVPKIGSHLEKSGSFKIIQKIGSHLEKSGQFWKNPENWQSSGKIQTVLKSSRKLLVISKNPDSFEIIRKIGSHLENLDSFEIIRKIGSHLEKFGQFWNHAEKWQSSGKIRTVLK